MARLDAEWLAQKGRTIRPTPTPRELYDRLKFVAGLVAVAPTGARRGPRLLWRNERGEVMSLGLRERLVLGRAADCDLTFANVRVSRRHCEITLVGGMASLSDLGSANGTIHNGKRLTAPALLRDGDLIEIGGALLVFVA